MFYLTFFKDKGVLLELDFMNSKKERLQEVFEHLRRHNGIFYQKDLAIAIGIKRTSLCLAMNGNEAYLTDSLFRRICKAYPGVFNINYLLTGEGQLLLEPVEPQKEEPKKSPLEQGLENLLQVAAQLIKDNEEQRRELHSCIQELRESIAMLNQGKTYQKPIQDNYGVSESTSKLKK